MRPFETIASVLTPEGKTLSLHRHDRDFYIHLDGDELMSTRRHGSEAALAQRAIEALGRRPAPRVLIGGLGLGYTLRAALDVLPEDARVVVAEIFPAVVAWHRDELQELATPLDDPRVEVREQDVARVLEEPPDGAWDVLLFDVDNGPSACCLDANADLYSYRGVGQMRSSLDPDGILGVWSAYQDAGFLDRLKKTGFSAHVEIARDRGKKGARSYLFLAHLR